MSNPSKDKGDRYEREAVAHLIEFYPDLMVWNAQRMLGAGRKEDIGDLLVFPDAVVQVKAFKATALSAGLYQAARGARDQSGHARHPYNVGVVLVPRARKVGAVRWAASALTWPIEANHQIHKNSLSALAAVTAAGPLSRLTTQVHRKNTDPIIIASLDTWVAAYRTASGRELTT
jgi:hypothetical protein